MSTCADDRCAHHVTAASKNKVPGGCGCVGESLKSRLTGLLLIILIWSLLLLYAEAIGFAAEVVVMTSLGVVLNFGSDAARRVVLVGWGVVYAAAYYRAAVGIYLEFSRAVFAAVKGRLANRGLGAAALREDRNTAFKYFTADDIRRLAAVEASTEDTDAPAEVPCPAPVPDDSIEYQTNLLHWKITSLSLLVDRRGTAYIPRDLFARLCRLDVPGAPRSGIRVVLTAVGRMVIAGLFLLVLGLVAELSADAGVSDGTEGVVRTLVTLGLGAVPLVIHAVYSRFTIGRHFGSELFAAKVERALLSYTQSWPVFDLAFQRRQTGHDEPMTSRPEVTCDQSSSDATELKTASSPPRRYHDNHTAPGASRNVSRVK